MVWSRVFFIVRVTVSLCHCVTCSTCLCSVSSLVAFFTALFGFVSFFLVALSLLVPVSLRLLVLLLRRCVLLSSSVPCFGSCSGCVLTAVPRFRKRLSALVQSACLYGSLPLSPGCPTFNFILFCWKPSCFSLGALRTPVFLSLSACIP